MNIVSMMPKLKEELRTIFNDYGLKYVFDTNSQEIKVMKEKKPGEIFLIPFHSIADTLQRMIFYKAAIESNSESALVFEEPEVVPLLPKFMTEEEMNLCIERGAEVVRQCHAEGCNVLSLGEMGIGNTSSSSMWMTCFTHIPLELCVGAGSGLDNAGVRHKYNVLQQALDHYQGDGSAHDLIRYFGGLEMVMAIGAMLQAAELKMIILVDGFIMTNCILAASQLYPEVLHYAIFGHQGDEAGHKLVLDAMGAKPLLNLGLRLGEGTGAICSYPIIDSAIRMINEMDNFAHAAITKYF